MPAPCLRSSPTDAVGRPLLEQHPDGARAQWVYDNDTTRSWQTSTDELNHSTVTYFDAYSRVAATREQAANGNADTTYHYNAADELEMITDPAGNTTSLTWDMRGDNRSIADSDRGEWTYRYDRTGNSTLQIDGNEQWTRYTYDKTGRIESKTYPSYREVRWYYDEAGHGKSAGRLTSITDTQESSCPLKIGAGGHITKQLFYDAYGRMESSKQCLDGKTVEMKYSYDKLDRLRTVSYPDGEIVTYNYNPAGRLKSVSGYVDQFTYNAAGQTTNTNFGNGVTEINDYDTGREWLNHITVMHGLSTLFDAGYERYPNGLVRKTTSTTNQTNLTYTYDQANQLTDVTGDYTQNLDYDASRNITFNSAIGTYDYSAPGGTVARCGTPAKSIPCPHAVKRAGSTTFGYDAVGNLTTVTPGGNPVTKLRGISWNKDNEPYLLTNDGGVQTSARYDESGQRVYRSRGNHVSQYYEPYVDLEHIQGQAATNSVQYYYAGDQLLARKDATGKHWYHSDQIGSTRVITGQNGTSSAGYNYTPFGEALSNGGGPAYADRGFTGQRSESDNDLVYMNARYYSPSLGRFISPDPIIPDIYQTGATNRYQYARNNPVTFVDPLGLDNADVNISTTPSGSPSSMGLSGGIHNPGPPMLDPTMQATAPPRFESLRSSVKRIVESEVAIGLPSPYSIRPSAAKGSGDYMSPEYATLGTIEGYIKEAASILGPSATRYEILNKARLNLDSDRGYTFISGNSESLILRDVERYLHGRVSAEKWTRTFGWPRIIAENGGPALNILYNTMKLGTRPLNAALGDLGVESRILQGSPDKPQSAIGGTDWFYLGLEHYRVEKPLLDQPGLPYIPGRGPQPPGMPVRLGLPFEWKIK